MLVRILVATMSLVAVEALAFVGLMRVLHYVAINVGYFFAKPRTGCNTCKRKGPSCKTGALNRLSNYELNFSLFMDFIIQSIQHHFCSS